MTWPFSGDTALDRARRIANSLLGLLPEPERSIWAARAHALGETWLGERLVTYTPDQAITTHQAAELLNVSGDVIRQWACQKLPDGRALLRREGLRGREQTYLVRNVLDAAFHARRRGRLTSADV